MSDTEDDDGSGPEAADGDDGFDKEAEREKLREKYERDQQRREATQQMSELLLKGATMTNQHCEECRSPIFRMDGEQFCPNCGGTRGEVGDEQSGDGQSTSDQPPTDDRQPAEGQRAPASDKPDAADRVDETGAADEGARTVDAATAGQTPGRDDRGGEPSRGSRERVTTAGAATGGNAGDDPAEEPATSGGDHPSDRGLGDRDGPRSPGGRGGSAGDRRHSPRRRDPDRHQASVEEAPSLAQAQASLRRAIVSLSEQAAQSDDPVRAKELLEAAGEASAALADLQS